MRLFGSGTGASNTSGNIMSKDWFKDTPWKHKVYFIHPIR